MVGVGKVPAILCGGANIGQTRKYENYMQKNTFGGFGKVGDGLGNSASSLLLID